MRLFLAIFVVFHYCFAYLRHEFASDRSPTAGKIGSMEKKHVVALVTEYPVSATFRRNASGHRVEILGVSPLILEWLKLRYRFAYSIPDIMGLTTPEDRGPNLPGTISYAMKGECDVIMGALVPTPERFKKIDFLQPWLLDSISLLIPNPSVSQNNIDAILKPFSFWVWIGIVLAAGFVTCSVWAFRRFLKSNQNHIRDTTKNVGMYILGTLLNQGGNLLCKVLKIRFVIGSWCLLSLVLVNTYNGTLISYVTVTRHAEPLIESVYDVVADESLYVVVLKGLGTDAILSTGQSGVYKVLGDRLRRYPDSRCNTSSKCIELVKMKPPRHVYFHGKMALKTALREDYLKTNKCQLTIATGEPLLIAAFGWGIQKNSPYTEAFNRGMLTLSDVGLLRYWIKQQEPETRPCYNGKKYPNMSANRKKGTLTRLTLVNLAGAYAILALGYFSSLLVFIIEICRGSRTCN